jgi:hypothetical protein
MYFGRRGRRGSIRPALVAGYEVLGTMGLATALLTAGCATGDVNDGADVVLDGTRDASAGDASRDTGAPGPDSGPALDAGAHDAAVVPGDDATSPQVDGGADPGVDASAPKDAGTDTGVVLPDAGCPLRLVVNELQSAGATAADEFIELYNPTACPVALAGWTLRYASVTGSTVSTVWTGAIGKSVPVGGYAVVAGSGFAGAATVGVFTGTGTLAAAGGGIGIFDPSGTRTDSVGYGSATNPLVEGAPAPAPAASVSIARKPDGTDHDTNSADFKTATTPTPGAAN